MDINEFVSNFADQMDETDPSEIKATTVFRDLEDWSSLAALSIIAMVDEEYEVTLGAEDMRAAKTVEDLFNIVSAKK